MSLQLLYFLWRFYEIAQTKGNILHERDNLIINVTYTNSKFLFSKSRCKGLLKCETLCSIKQKLKRQTCSLYDSPLTTSCPLYDSLFTNHFRLVRYERKDGTKILRSNFHLFPKITLVFFTYIINYETKV